MSVRAEHGTFQLDEQTLLALASEMLWDAASDDAGELVQDATYRILSVHKGQLTIEYVGYSEVEE